MTDAACGNDKELIVDRRDYLIILGVPKSGTTSIASFMSQLPDVVVARSKETGFFTDFSDRTWSGPGAGFADALVSSEAAFAEEFAADPKARLRVEASTDNLWCPGTAERILEFSNRSDVGAVHLVAIFRDPVARIVSEYEHTLRLGWQKATLLESLRAEPERRRQGWHPLFYHVERSRYATQLKPYRDLFGDRLLVLDFHTLSTGDWTDTLLEFVNLPKPADIPVLERKNERYVSSRPWLNRGLKNPAIQSLGRALVPPRFRSAIRSAITPKSTERYRPSPEELAFVKDALANDIAACLKDPGIPTDNWSDLI